MKTIWLILPLILFWSACGGPVETDKDATADISNNPPGDNAPLGEPDGPSMGPDDSGGLKLVATLPSDGATGVSPDSLLQIEFDQPVDLTSIVLDTTGNVCEGSIQLSAYDFSFCHPFSSEIQTAEQGKRIILTPITTLLGDNNYQLKVTGQILGMDQAALDQEVVTSFETQAVASHLLEGIWIGTLDGGPPHFASSGALDLTLTISFDGGELGGSLDVDDEAFSDEPIFDIEFSEDQLSFSVIQHNFYDEAVVFEATLTNGVLEGGWDHRGLHTGSWTAEKQEERADQKRTF